MSFMPTVDTAPIFTHARTVVNGMLPYIYVTGGIAVGFAIVGRIISAFKRT